MTTGHSLLKDLIQANVVVDSTVAATEVVAETVEEAVTEVVAETVDEVEIEAVADLDNVAKAAVAAPVDIEDYTK